MFWWLFPYGVGLMLYVKIFSKILGFLVLLYVLMAISLNDYILGFYKGGVSFRCSLFLLPMLCALSCKDLNFASLTFDLPKNTRTFRVRNISHSLRTPLCFLDFFLWGKIFIKNQGIGFSPHYLHIQLPEVNNEWTMNQEINTINTILECTMWIYPC